MSFSLSANVVCLLGALSAPPSATGSALPDAWHGVWVGQLTVHTAKGKSFDRPIELKLLPVKGGQAYSWRMVTGIDNKTTVRDYELIPDPEKPGRFRLDEKNGIVLNAQLMGNALYSYFKDGDVLITARYELRGESLHVEMASVSMKDPLVSVIKEAQVEIQSYLLGSVQVGELRKKK